jgi:UDP-N-acetylglucosamine 1-carboxyvinyltransferase
MDILTIEGGRKLKGEMTISGSKNSALPILIATLLTDEPCRIRNVPDLDDIETVVALLVFLGKNVLRRNESVEVTAGPTLHAEAPYELVRKMRASIVVMGPLLARLGHVKASLPGGCAIGGRPINIHLDGFRRLGAEIELEQGYVDVSSKKLQGAVIPLDFASVGATENLMMAASLISGRTEIHNAAMEPEIEDLANFLNAMGARVTGAGTARVVIEGVSHMHGATHVVIPDRIETGSYMIAAAMTQGDVVLRKVCTGHLVALIDKMKQAGIELEDNESTIRVLGPKKILPVSIETAVHPGFPTDLQAQWMVLMAISNGVAQVTEKVFENRFMHVPELTRMGARIETKGKTATIIGVDSLSGANVMVSDLRAGAALVLAGLAALGQTVIHRVYHLDRGYERLEGKLSAIGAQITRAKEP